MSKKTLTLIILVILIALGGGYYWFFIRVPSLSVNTNSGGNTNSGNGIFGSFGGVNSPQNGNQSSQSSTTATTSSPTALAVPILRELSVAPVGGMTSSTTASTTITRWIERGTGHIYQAYSDNTAVDEISNTTIPMIYESYWDDTANAFIFTSLDDTGSTLTHFYATIKPTVPTETASTSSSTSQVTPYFLAGSPLPSNTIDLSVSPAEKVSGKLTNQVFTLVKNGSGGSTGYIANFDGSKKTQIFDTPLTDINIQWPTANTIAITTKGTALGAGYLYFVNPKNGAFNKIIGGINGLATLVNDDASEVLYSRTNQTGTGLTTSIYTVSTGQSQDLPFGTLAEKCVWSKLQTSDLYCAIPSNIPTATYPDAWYQGTVSFNDSIWEINTITGDVHKLVDLTKTAGQSIDAENLQLSPKEDFLYFINKKDLSLWSFDLNAI